MRAWERSHGRDLLGSLGIAYEAADLMEIWRARIGRRNALRYEADIKFADPCCKRIKVHVSPIVGVLAGRSAPVGVDQLTTNVGYSEDEHAIK